MGTRGVWGKSKLRLLKWCRAIVAGLLAAPMLMPTVSAPALASEGDRTLYLYHTHTRETGKFTYKRNGNFDAKVLQQLNIFLADWRTKEPTKMDPALFDLMWAVYRDVRATKPISIVSSYRSPKTNAMLASKSSGVADNSQHIAGKAIDFFIPGVDLGTLRAAAMRYQVGGVGYYPTSGSPFVHLDTGSVRAWPRMTRAQLQKVFPDGKTLHLPTDGKPISSQGRAYAEAQWKQCRSVPCGNSPFGKGAPVNPYPALDSPSGTMIASLPPDTAPVPLMRPRGLGGDPDQRVVATVAVASTSFATAAPVPAQKSARLLLATGGTALPADSNTALAALSGFSDVPQPRVLMTPRPEVATAYVGDAQAQQALRAIIEDETTASISAAVGPGSPAGEALQANPLGGEASVVVDGMFAMTFSAVESMDKPGNVAVALAALVESRQPNPSIVAREDIDLVAPELDHVNQTLVMPVLMSEAHFAVFSEAEGYLDKGTELGAFAERIGFLPEGPEPAYDRFAPTKPLLVASR